MPRSSSSESSGSTSSASKHRRSDRKDRRGKHSRSRSRSKTQSSPERSRRGGRRQRSRSTSREKKGASSSRSFRKERQYQRVSSRSRDQSRTKDDTVKRSTAESSQKNPSLTMPKNNEDQLKQKMQLALQAAAHADAQLREQGILTAKPKEWGRYADEKTQTPVKVENRWPSEPALTVKEQLERAKALDEINSASFHQTAFVSGLTNATQAKESDVALDNHDSAMFGLGDPNILPIGVKTQTTKISNVAHENLFANAAVKEEKWIRKLFLMRQRKLNGEAMN